MADQGAAPPPPPGEQNLPTKICPHCGAQNQTIFRNCPTCGKKYKKGSGFKTFAIIVGGGLLVLVLGVVGCAALIGAGVDEANDEAQEHAISRSQFESVQQGTTQSQVESDLGEPDDSQEFESKFGGKVQGSSCIYYNEKGKDLFEGDSYQFCFTNGKLDSKNVY